MAEQPLYIINANPVDCRVCFLVTSAAAVIFLSMLTYQASTSRTGEAAFKKLCCIWRVVRGWGASRVAGPFAYARRHGSSLNRQSSGFDHAADGRRGCHEDCTDRPVDGERAPRLYGGTERIVFWLTEELVREGTP